MPGINKIALIAGYGMQDQSPNLTVIARHAVPKQSFDDCAVAKRLLRYARNDGK